jgi:hypothetical protein
VAKIQDIRDLVPETFEGVDAPEDELGSMLPGDEGDPLDHIAARHENIAGRIEREVAASRAAHERVEAALAAGEDPIHPRHRPIPDRGGTTQPYSGDHLATKGPAAVSDAEPPPSGKRFPVVKVD